MINDVPLSDLPQERVHLYQPTPPSAEHCIRALKKHLPYNAEGCVGVAHARADGRYVLALFNNLGVIKTEKGETTVSNDAQSSLVHGPCAHVEHLVGGEYVTALHDNTIQLRIPPGVLSLLSFPDSDAN